VPRFNQHNNMMVWATRGQSADISECDDLRVLKQYIVLHITHTTAYLYQNITCYKSAHHWYKHCMQDHVNFSLDVRWSYILDSMFVWITSEASYIDTQRVSILLTKHITHTHTRARLLAHRHKLSTTIVSVTQRQIVETLSQDLAVRLPDAHVVRVSDPEYSIPEDGWW